MELAKRMRKYRNDRKSKFYLKSCACESSARKFQISDFANAAILTSHAQVMCFDLAFYINFLTIALLMRVKNMLINENPYQNEKCTFK